MYILCICIHIILYFIYCTKCRVLASNFLFINPHTSIEVWCLQHVDYGSGLFLSEPFNKLQWWFHSLLWSSLHAVHWWRVGAVEIVEFESVPRWRRSWCAEAPYLFLFICLYFADCGCALPLSFLMIYQTFLNSTLPDPQINNNWVMTHSDLCDRGQSSPYCMHTFPWLHNTEVPSIVLFLLMWNWCHWIFFVNRYSFIHLFFKIVFIHIQWNPENTAYWKISTL